MRVTLFQKILIMFKIFCVGFRDASLIILVSLFAKNKRSSFDRIVHSWGLAVLRIMRVKYKILNPTGFTFETGRPYMIMSNHASHFDIPLIYTTFPNDTISMIAKKELFRIPVFGKGMALSGCVSIDRENKRQAIKDLKNAKESMLNGVRLWVAPEGTRSRTGEMGEFKKGGFKVAMAMKAVIVPVTIIGSRKILPAKTLDFSLDEEVEVYIGKPIDTAQYQNKDIKQLIMDTKNEIAATLSRHEANKYSGNLYNDDTTKRGDKNE